MKQLVKRDKLALLEKEANEMEIARNKADWKGLFKKVQAITGEKRVQIKIKVQGKIIEEPAIIYSRDFSAYFENLFNVANPWDEEMVNK